MSFRFADMFAGIGGFHAALGALGGECVYASEIDEDAARVYRHNWGLRPDGDITLAANDTTMRIPEHDVLVGGFPCQPFSKSGKQRGMDEARGTLFWNIAKIIEVRRPAMVLLENVRNLAGPRHTHEWDVIIQTLRSFGYRVSSVPFVVSPHRIRPEFGGRPQVRERVFIAGTLAYQTGSHLSEEPLTLDLANVECQWNPLSWDLNKHLPLEKLGGRSRQSLGLSDAETEWIEAWNEFVVLMKPRLSESGLPGFPIWVDAWTDSDSLSIPLGTPDWKKNFLIKNAAFYTEHRSVLDPWLHRWSNLEHFPPSRRKFEWQAQETKDLWSTVLHFRPSGIRAKKATYVPAMVAITQTSIIGTQRRRLSTREGARLQGLPDWFNFLDQSDAVTFKQLGNAVNVGVVYNVLRSQVLRDLDLLVDRPELVRSILGASPNPDFLLADQSKFHRIPSLTNGSLPDADQLDLRFA
jgi:DNA (cytosine-5)-methyltransferase 1